MNSAAIYDYTSGICVGILGTGTVRTIDMDKRLLIEPISKGAKVSVSKCVASRRILKFGPFVGHYRGFPIPDWVIMGDGVFYHFKNTIPEKLDIKDLETGQVVLTPGMLYDNDDISAQFRDWRDTVPAIG